MISNALTTFAKEDQSFMQICEHSVVLILICFKKFEKWRIDSGESWKLRSYPKPNSDEQLFPIV